MGIVPSVSTTGGVKRKITKPRSPQLWLCFNSHEIDLLVLLRLSAEGTGGPVSVRGGASGKDSSNAGWSDYFCSQASNAARSRKKDLPRQGCNFEK